MANLPQDKKLTKVVYTYDDGSTYMLDENNSSNLQKNMNLSGGIMATRSYITFAPVEWIEVEKIDDTPKWLTQEVMKKTLEILKNTEGKEYVEGKGNAKAEALHYLLEISQKNNDRSNFGIRNGLDYIDTLIKANNIVNQYAKDYSPKREVRFPTEEDMHCPSADCGNVTPHILQKANTSDGSENKEELWTCMLCSHQLK